LLYRALPELEPTRPMPHTVFGKHLLADFYCARFDAEEQSYEELITVEDDPS
jgi:hypothetical protein